MQVRILSSRQEEQLALVLHDVPLTPPVAGMFLTIHGDVAQLRRAGHR